MDWGKFWSLNKMQVQNSCLIAIIIATASQVISGVKEESVRNKIDEFSEEKAMDFIKTLNEEYTEKINDVVTSQWNYYTNDNYYSLKDMDDSSAKFTSYKMEQAKRLQPWKPYWKSFKNEELKRQFRFHFRMENIYQLPAHKDVEIARISHQMQTSYQSAMICTYRNQSKCDLTTTTEIKEILQTSQDYDELLYFWEAWRNAVGKPIRNIYPRFIELTNENARMNGYSSLADMWIDTYSSESFEADISNLYYQLRPLYEQLHAYVRRNLREKFGKSRISKRGPIPAHVLSSWNNMFDILKPYQNTTSVNIMKEMIYQNYTVKRIFEKADDFFHALGFEKAPQSFWKDSIFEKPSDGRKFHCFASAWDFFNGKDFRIKACAKVCEEDLYMAHHEMGHIHYFMSYRNLPIPFRNAANPGFGEAVGDLIHMSMSTPMYLHKIGLLDHVENSYESDINFLLKTALNTLAFLPFGYLLDRYRWDVMRGKITSDNYTHVWWKYRRNFQGITNPIIRSEEDFDPGSHLHVVMNVPYIRYFVSSILQFQFHKSLCMIAGKYHPANPQLLLHHCDISNSRKAGRALKKMLSLGSSIHWSEALKILTGTERMDASAIQEYFRPLEEWLKEDNKKHNEFVGWE